MNFKTPEVLDFTWFYGLSWRYMRLCEIGRSPTIPSFIYAFISLYLYKIGRLRTRALRPGEHSPPADSSSANALLLFFLRELLCLRHETSDRAPPIIA